MWGAPVYVLHPTLQQGKKLPRWEPRSRRGVFVGFSPDHSSDVPLVLNLSTGSVSPQFHVVFDDEFTTVPSLSVDEDPPTFWNDLDLLDHIHRIPLDSDSRVTLNDEWLTPVEQEERDRIQTRQTILRQSLQSSSTQVPGVTPTVMPTATPITNDTSPTTLDPPIPPQRQHLQSQVLDISLDLTPRFLVSAAQPTVSAATSPNNDLIPQNPSSSITAPRRSTRSNQGTHPSTRFINEAFLTPICDQS